MVGPGGVPENTTISALVTLTAVQLDNGQTAPRVIVWHNAVARLPFPSDLFCGPYDSHFGIVPLEDGGTGQGLTYRGASLPPRKEF